MIAERLPPGDVETVDRLIGDWRIYQLRRGHRFSTDDLLTAWCAARAAPGARTLLDLGSGIGSVGLMALWWMEPCATLRSVEVQALSVGLATRTVVLNGLQDRVELVNADLRDPGVVPQTGTHDLVTGSPPYIPLGSGLVSSHPQRAGARMELKGDVFDYCRAADRALSPDGVFVFCHSASDKRPEKAIAGAGLVLRSRQDVVFRYGQAPMIALFTCARSGVRKDPGPLWIRDENQEWTGEYLKIRGEMGGVLPEIGRSFG